jgi:hypothetical protein
MLDIINNIASTTCTAPFLRFIHDNRSCVQKYVKRIDKKIRDCRDPVIRTNLEQERNDFLLAYQKFFAAFHQPYENEISSADTIEPCIFCKRLYYQYDYADIIHMEYAGCNKCNSSNYICKNCIMNNRQAPCSTCLYWECPNCNKTNPMIVEPITDYLASAYAKTNIILPVNVILLIQEYYPYTCDTLHCFDCVHENLTLKNKKYKNIKK